MSTNLALDDQLILEAKRLGNYATKREAVNAALEEFVRRRKQLEILKFVGTVDFDPDYDYKKLRRMR
jgi:Arc/MetJ family transcription regulator